ncbi:hypothetical protein FB451DRAFT_495260 [Mycena latifolia]|nr:hypothetical protein FB451DRAFT_495260 [Mycena latifolia]
MLGPAAWALLEHLHAGDACFFFSLGPLTSQTAPRCTARTAPSPRQRSRERCQAHPNETQCTSACPAKRSSPVYDLDSRLGFRGYSHLCLESTTWWIWNRF